MTNILSRLKTNLTELYSEMNEGDIETSSGLFVQTVELRNELARENGFANYLEMQIQRNGVPDKDWSSYLTHKPKIEVHISQSDPKSYPHFLKQLESVDIEFPNGVYALFVNKISPELIGRIGLVVEGEKAMYNYSPETDKYKITIPNSSHNQKIAMLIHELSHVVDSEENGKVTKNRYQGEKSAIKSEFFLTRSISDDFFDANLREYLACFVRTEFEEMIYLNPSMATPENFSTIYGNYYGNSGDQNIYLYLFDRKIIDKPFVDLSATVAIANLLTE